MKRIILLVLVASLTLTAWASAQQTELADHLEGIRMEAMDNGSCPPSSNPSGGG
jgi:hypothetical protein